MKNVSRICLLSVLFLTVATVIVQKVHAGAKQNELTVQISFVGYNSDPENQRGCEVNLCALLYFGAVNPSDFFDAFLYDGVEHEELVWQYDGTYPERWRAYLDTDQVHSSNRLQVQCAAGVRCLVGNLDALCYNWADDGPGRIRRVPGNIAACLRFLPFIGGVFG